MPELLMCFHRTIFDAEARQDRLSVSVTCLNCDLHTNYKRDVLCVLQFTEQTTRVHRL